jgi:SsrA-binding protein
MAGSNKRANMAPRISNKRAMHDYHISGKLECGMVLVGSEVKSLRNGKAHLQEAFARVENSELILHGMHIEPYDQASVYNHLPTRDRKLLIHRREIRRLEQETQQKGTTLIPLAVYFKNGRVKVELGVARGKREHDKRDAIRRKEQDREIRRAMSHRA